MLHEKLAKIKTRFRQQGLDTALNHLNRAENALSRQEWESANSQVRACLEALFDEIARIKLSSSKIGGPARKELEASGVLREPEARLVQTFFNVAGSAGSHAGTSNDDEAQGRFLIGVGICLLGLDIIPELTRVEDALADELVHPSDPEAYESGEYDPSQVQRQAGKDGTISTSCPSCGHKQLLNECSIRREGRETVYWCRNDCQKLIVVEPLPKGAQQLPGNRGLIWGRYVIRNVSELYIPFYSTNTEEEDSTLRLFALRQALVSRNILENSGDEHDIHIGILSPSNKTHRTTDL